MNDDGTVLPVTAPFLFPRSAPCHECSMAFTTRADLMTHQATAHKKIGRFICPVVECQKRFKTALTLKRHETLHTGKRYKCPVCSKEQRSQAHYYTHVKVHRKRGEVAPTPLPSTSSKKPSNSQITIAPIHQLRQSSEKQTPMVASGSFATDGFSTSQVYPPDGLSTNQVYTPALSTNQVYPTASVETRDTNSFLDVKIKLEVDNPSDSLDDSDSGHQPIPETEFVKVELFTEGTVKQEEPEFDFGHCMDTLPLGVSVKTEGIREVSNETWNVGYGTTPLNEKSFESAILSRHSCPTCAKEFDEKESLKIHVATHQKMALFGKRTKCSLCSKSFTGIMPLQRHLLTHKGEEPHHCHLCNERFFEEYELNLHIRIRHVNRSTYKCDICEDTFENAVKRSWHMRSHKTALSRVYPCRVCGKVFASTHGMKKHMETSHDKYTVRLGLTDVLKIAYPAGSESVFFSNPEDSSIESESAEQLLVPIEKPVVKIYKCEICKMNLTSHGYWTRHMQNIHPVKSDENAGSRPNQDISNTSEQDGADESSQTKKFNCTICNRQFKTLRANQRHFKSYHYMARATASLYKRMLKPKKTTKSRVSEDLSEKLEL